MTSFLRSDRSRPVAIWLFAVAILVLAMVMVGGATRLTGSGLSITQWKPVSGILPPLSSQDWAAEFARYRQIPQYDQLNRGMSLAQFQGIYWWEWIHRLLARIVGAAFLIPFVVFLARREIPQRLILRCVGLFALGGLQAAVGWWMVSSGLSERVSVAPERLAVHLGLAFLLLGALIWTALDAWSGGARQTLPSSWGRRASLLIGLIYLQILLGALVAGNDAGFVYNDWPLMNGALLPEGYGHGRLWTTLAHDQGSVQLHHRLIAYLLFVLAVGYAFAARRSRYLSAQPKGLAVAVAGAVCVQAGLGIATLISGTPLWLALLHQFTAAVVLGLAVCFGWRVRRP